MTKINEARVPQTGDCPDCGHDIGQHSSPSTGDTICYGGKGGLLGDDKFGCPCGRTFPFVEEANLTGSWNRMSKDIRIDGLRELGVPEDFIDIVYRLDFGEILSQYPEIAEWMKESGDITGIGMWNEDKKADPINEWQTGNQMIPTDSEYQTSHFDWANPKLGDFESKAREEIDWSYDGQEPDYDPKYDAWSVFDDNKFTEDDMFAEKELGTADPFNIDWTTPDPTGMAKDEFGNPVKSHPSQYTMGGWDWEEKERMKSRGDVDFDPLLDNPQFNFESFQKKYSMCKGCMQNALEKLSKSKEYVEPVFHNYWTCPDCGQEDMTKTMGSDMMPWVDDVTKHYVNSHGMTEEEAKGFDPKTGLYDGDSKFDQVWKDWNTNSVQVSGTPDEHMIQDYESKSSEGGDSDWVDNPDEWGFNTFDEEGQTVYREIDTNEEIPMTDPRVMRRVLGNYESKTSEDYNDDFDWGLDDTEIKDLPLETIRVPDITPADVVDQYGNPDPNPSHIFPKSSWNFPSCPNCGSDDVSTDDIPRYAEPTWEEGEQIRLDCYNCGSSFNLNAYNATSYESKAKEDWDGFDDDGYYVGTTDDVQQDLYNMTSHDYSEDLYMKWQGILTEELQRKGALKPDFQGYTPDAIYEWLSSNGLPEDLIYDLASEFGEHGGQTSMGESKASEGRCRICGIEFPHDVSMHDIDEHERVFHQESETKDEEEDDLDEYGRNVNQDEAKFSDLWKDQESNTTEEDKLSPEELKKYKGRLGGDETLTESQLIEKGNESYKVLENNSSIRFE